MNDFWQGLLVGGVAGGAIGYLVRWFLDYTRAVFERGGLIRLTVHSAYPSGQPPECYFIRVVNHAPDREVEIKDVWFETTPRVAVLNPQRPLPATLRAGAMWETWIPMAEVLTRDLDQAARQVHLRLSTGQLIRSLGRTPDADLGPGVGGIAGGT